MHSYWKFALSTVKCTGEVESALYSSEVYTIHLLYNPHHIKIKKMFYAVAKTNQLKSNQWRIVQITN